MRRSFSQPLSVDVLRMNFQSKLEGMPRRSAKLIIDTLTSLESVRSVTRKLEMLLDCAFNISQLAAQSGTPAVADAYRYAQKILSESLAYQVSKIPLHDLVDFAPKLSELLCHAVLDVAMLRAAMLLGLNQAITECSIDRCLSWRDIEKLVSQLLELRDFFELCPVVNSVSSQIARVLFDLVRRSSSKQMPEALRRGFSLLGSWQQATYEATELCRSWVPGWLLQEASIVAQQIESFDAIWWVDILRTVALLGMLERTRLVEICDDLAPGFAHVGVRTKTTSSWNIESIGLVVVRQLASALAENPAGVQYDAPWLWFDCPDNWAAVFSGDTATLAGRRSVKLSPLSVPPRGAARLARTLSSPDLLCSPSSNRADPRRSTFNETVASPFWAQRRGRLMAEPRHSRGSFAASSGSP
jgi:hypothetical protein